MADSEQKELSRSSGERIDELFANSRLKIEQVIILLTEKVEKRLSEMALEGKGITELDHLLDHLERLIFLGQMNRAKTRDLLHMAPKKYQRIMTDGELLAELKPVRDADNFPKRGPRGPREDVTGETPPEES